MNDTSCADRSEKITRPAPRGGSRLAVALVLVAWGMGALRPVWAQAAEQRVVRLGIAAGMWAGVNATDANAAIRAWAKAVLKGRGDSIEVETRMFDTPALLGQALQAAEIDGASISTEAFLKLDPGLLPTHLYVAMKQQSVEERYVVLVHGAGEVQDLRALKERKLVVHRSARMSLAPAWLDPLLKAAEVPRPPAGHGSTESASRAVLGVYFRQFDACVVTSNAFALACELNPQLHSRLRILAISPPVIPTVFFFRSSYTDPVKVELEDAILTLHATAEGRQVLAVFQCERMEKRALNCLDETRKLFLVPQAVAPASE